MCYFKGTSNHGLLYKRRPNLKSLPKNIITHHGYYNVNWASDIDTKSSTFGFILILSLGVASWTNKRKMTIVSFSS